MSVTNILPQMDEDEKSDARSMREIELQRRRQTIGRAINFYKNKFFCPEDIHHGEEPGDCFFASLLVHLNGMCSSLDDIKAGIRKSYWGNKLHETVPALIAEFLFHNVKTLRRFTACAMRNCSRLRDLGFITNERIHAIEHQHAYIDESTMVALAEEMEVCFQIWTTMESTDLQLYVKLGIGTKCFNFWYCAFDNPFSTIARNLNHFRPLLRN